MCELFISADPHGYAGRTRSVRLHGVVTSIRLENLFWEVLEEIAARDGMGVVQLIEKLYDELITARGEAGNFASFLRVSALRYEALLAHQAVPADVNVPLRSLDAQQALQRLPARWQAPLKPQLPNSSFSSSARAWPAAKSSAPV
jgi:predicted DNA-binding ribbon-helix-helix protein